MFRLNVIPVFLPPLRERGEDIRLLTQHFVTQFGTEFRKTVTSIEEAAFQRLFTYAWPGNVRELRNVLERAVLLCKGESISAADIVLGQVERPTEATDASALVLPQAGLDLREVENSLIRQALARANNNQTQAAKLLNLSRDAFRYRLEKLGLL